MSKIEYSKEERLKVVHSTLIIRVPAIKYYTGLTIHQFAQKYNLWGVTNGKLWCLAEMMFPSDVLEQVARDILKHRGLKENLDWVLTYERDCYLEPFESGYLYQDIPELEGLNWIESIMLESGNWIWHKGKI